MQRNFFLAMMTFVCMLALLIGCAGRAYLIVDYELPPNGQKLQGQTVKMVIKDQRDDRAIFTPAAAQEFKGFKDRYSLSWNLENGQRVVVGEYDIENLFLKTFSKRLERMGILVTSDKQSYAPEFEIILEKFKIDLRGRKWVADVIYEVSLSKDSHLIARDKITGSAERLKVIGRKGADRVLSEIFSEIINRADIVKLFQQAKLI